MPREAHSTRKLLAINLRLARVARGWSQDDLAKAGGMHRSYIGGIERAERNISLDNIEKLADIFRLAPAQLLDINFVPPKHFPSTNVNEVGYAPATPQGRRQGGDKPSGKDDDATN